MRLAYIRVSTEEQNPDRQIIEIKGRYPDIKDNHIYVDKQTGKTTDRPEYNKMKTRIEIAREDNISVELIIHELDRLGRDKDLIKKELEEFQKQGVVVRILNLPTTLISYEDDPLGILKMVHNILMEVMSTMAEAEMQTRAKRQREGIALAKKAGKYKGRKRVEVNSNDFEKVYSQWKQKKITATQGMKLLNIKPNTFYRRVKEYEDNDIIHVY